ncbi:MAG TPA: DUF4190 domain-containing protein [Actinomycetota bacterium]
MSVRTWFCARCGSHLEEGDRYCGSCGAPSGRSPGSTVEASASSASATRWERVFREGGPADRAIAEQDARHEAVFGPSRARAGTPIQPGARTNGTAVAALILSLVGLVIGSILGVALGYQAQREIDGSAGTQTGRGLATAGIILGWIGLAAWGLVFLVAVTSR